MHKLCISYRTVQQIAQFHTQHLLNKIKSRNPMRHTHSCTTSLLSYFFGQFIFVSILWYLLFFNTNNNLLKSKWSLPHMQIYFKTNSNWLKSKFQRLDKNCSCSALNTHLQIIAYLSSVLKQWAITLKIWKQEIWFIYTALPFNNSFLQFCVQVTF